MRSLSVCLLVLEAMGKSLTCTASGNVIENRYDPAAMVRISGSVQEVREVPEPPALKGIHVTVKNERAVFHVYLAPARFLRLFAITLKTGDELQIYGSKTRFKGADLVLARELRRNTDVLVLRDEKGNPYWEDEVLKRSLISRLSPHFDQLTGAAADHQRPVMRTVSDWTGSGVASSE